METSEALITEISHILKREAKAGRTISYSQLAQASSQDFGPRLTKLFPILQEICRREVAAGKGMLCSIVVKKGTDMPGKGFTKLATKLYGREIQDPQRFIRDEQERVWAFWRNESDSPEDAPYTTV